MNPTAGHILADGPYELVEPVGRGGMGEVWRARHLNLDRPAAVKLLLRRDGADEDWLDAARRLRDEARAAARVAHPALVELYDTGEDPDLGPWIAYEFLEGGNLRQTLRARRALPLPQTMDGVAEPLLSALAALHGAGTLHRDVKPENLLAGPDGRFKLGDLGLAVFADREAKTKTGILIGTPGYMPPETFGSAAPPGPGTDVYAAAMVLIECLAGRLPFDAPSAAERMRQQLTTDPSSSFLQALGVPAPLAPILAAAVTRDPGRRTSSAAALLEGLRSQGSATPSRTTSEDAVTRSQGRGVALPTRPVAADRSGAASPIRPASVPPPSGRRVAPAIVALLLILGLLLVALGSRSPGGREGDSPELVHLRRLLLALSTQPDDGDLGRLALLLPPENDPGVPAPARGRLHLLRHAADHDDPERALALAGPLLGDPLSRPAASRVIAGDVFDAIARRARETSAEWFHLVRTEDSPPPELRTAIDASAALLAALPVDCLPPPSRADVALLRLRLAACRADPPARIEALRLARQAQADPAIVGGADVSVLRDTAIVLAYSAGPVATERRLALELVRDAIARLQGRNASPDEIARLRFLEAVILVRALTSQIGSSPKLVGESLQILRDLDPAPLTEDTRRLRTVLLALVAACGNDPNPINELSRVMTPDSLLPEDRWWFYRARNEWSVIVGSAKGHPKDVEQLRKLTPDLFVNYMRMRGTSSGPADEERLRGQ